MADDTMTKLAAELADLEGDALAEHPKVKDLSPPEKTELVKAIGAHHEHKARRALSG